MELWQLRTFTVLAKTLHFTRAAEELNLSQPAVSHQIKSLENSIGEPLFVRDKDGVLLTKAGRTLYRHARKILDIADEMKLEITENKDVLSGKVVLGVVTRGLNNPFPLLYKKFRKLYPEIEIVMQSEHKLEHIVKKIRKGEIDIGLISHNPDTRGLTVIPYGEFELPLVVGKDHRLAKSQNVTVEDLRNEEWVMYDSSNRLHETFEHFLAENGVSPRKIYETNDGSVIRSMILHDNKISLLPAWGIFEELRDGKIIPLQLGNTQPRIQLKLVWNARRRTKPVSAVITYLLQEKMEGIELLKSEHKIQMENL